MRVLKLTEITSKDSGKKYMIKEVENFDGGIEFECNCPAFLFRNPLKKPCKHLVDYLLKRGGKNGQN